MAAALRWNGGRPLYRPEPEQRVLVERLIGLMVPEKEICRSFLIPPIGHPTFRRAFKEEIILGREKLRGRMRALMLRAAEGGSVSAIAYILSRVDPEFHRLADDATPPLADDAGGGGFDPSGGVMFYIPENGRDWEKTIEGEAIEGEAA